MNCVRCSQRTLLLLLVAMAVSVSLTLPAGASAATNLKTLAVLAKFPGETAPAVTVSDIRDKVFTGTYSARSFYLESSWNSLNLAGISDPANGDVVGYFDAEGTTPEWCNTGWSPELDPMRQNIRAAGIPLDSYDRVLYFFPTCERVGGNQMTENNAEIRGSSWSDVGIISHELGHLFWPTPTANIAHADGATCSADGFPATISTQCARIGYADSNDVMGVANGSVPHPSSTAIRTKMGILDASHTQTATAEASYELYTTAEQPTSGHIYNLRIPVAVRANMGDPGNAPGDGAPSMLNLEYRQSHGLFDQFEPWNVTPSGAQMRLSPDDSYSWGQLFMTLLLDANPHTSPDVPPSNTDYFYDDGSSRDPLGLDTGFYDPRNDILLSVVSKTASKMTVKYGKGLLAAEKTSVLINKSKQLVVQARAGYANDLRLRDDGNGNVTVRDSNAPVLAGAGCAAIDKVSVRCPLASFTAIIVNAGDRGDFVDVSVPSKIVTENGEAGNDTLVGGDGSETLNGGNDSDRIFARGGNDVLDGGNGVDTYNPGVGTDTISYASSTVAITATIDGTANDGAAGENEDVPATAENVTGGSGNDTIGGNGANNALDGGGGLDRLTYSWASAAITVSLATTAAQATGGAGSDTVKNFENLTGSDFNDSLTGTSAANNLVGGSGMDTISGLGGNDVIYARDGANDSISCSTGTDSVEADPLPNDGTVTSCETVSRA